MLGARRPAPRTVSLLVVLALGLSGFLTASSGAAAAPAARIHDARPATSCSFQEARDQILDPARPTGCGPGTADFAIAPQRTGTSFSQAADGGLCQPISTVNDACPSWVQTYDHPAGHSSNCPRFWGAQRILGPPPGTGSDVAEAQTVGPTAVFVTGFSCNEAGDLDMATVAYALSDGHQLWSARLAGSAQGDDIGFGIAVSPDGSRVYVTGTRDYTDAMTSEYVTIAYDASTGQQAWLAAYDGSPNGSNIATQVAVSADGDRVYVAGVSGQFGDTPVAGTATVSYVAGTGAQDWVARHDDPDQPVGRATGLAVVGNTVYVGGSAHEAVIPEGLQNFPFSYLVVAYRDDRALHLGHQLWAVNYDPAPGGHYDQPTGLEATPTGVYVTGATMIKWNLQALWNTNSSCNDHLGYQDWRYDTVALDPGTGHVVWKASYASQFGSYFNYAYDMAVSPNGNLVYVTGQAASARTNATCAGDAVTIAYDASTGEQVWQAHYYLSGSPTDDAKALGLATSPDGTTLFVTGYAFSQVAGSGVIGSADYFVAAYDAATGGLRWVARYSNSPLDFDFAYLLNVNPDGKTLVASGTFMPPVGDFPDANSYDYGTVAYSTAPPA